MFAEKVVKEFSADEQFAPRQKVHRIAVESIHNGFNVERHFSTFCNVWCTFRFDHPDPSLVSLMRLKLTDFRRIEATKFTMGLMNRHRKLVLLLYFDLCIFNNLGPFLDLRLHKGIELFRRTACRIGSHDSESFLYVRHI